MEKTQHSKVSKWSLIIAIVILLNLFINYSLSLVYGSPSYEDFCKNDYYAKPYTTELSKEEMEIQNAEYEKCNSAYNEARESAEEKVFITLISIGVIIFGLSFVAKNNYVLATALSLGAVLNFIIASMRYWGDANELLKVVILGIALVILIGLGIKKFSDK